MRRVLSTGPSPNDFFTPYTTTFKTGFSVNWPYPADQVLIPTGLSATDGAPAYKMNPLFEMHLRNLDHWSLGKAFAAEHPDLVEGVRIHDAAT